jgi:hypothetical protein
MSRFSIEQHNAITASLIKLGQRIRERGHHGVELAFDVDMPHQHRRAYQRR